MYSLITLKDLFIVPLTLMVAYFVSTRIKNKYINEQPHYKYFRMGLFVKIWVGLAFAGIYLLYYGGGDTTTYFFGSESIIKMAGKDFPTFIKILLGGNTDEIFSMFDYSTGWPEFWRDPNSFAVCRYNVPFYLLGLGSFLGNTIIMNLILYFGVWHFYNVLVKLYPNNAKGLAIAVFFVPSVVFWSSGILKDGWTLVAIMVMFSSFYYIFIAKEKIVANIFWLLLWSYIAFSIRPYIFYVALGSGLIWVSFSAIKAIKSTFLRTIALPFIIIITWATGVFVFAQMGAQASSRYSNMDAMLETAWVIQDDLKKDYYGGNSFDIGAFDPTLGGVLKKAPKAIVAGMFRPFLWEGNGILMILTGLESMVLLVLIGYLLFSFRVSRFFINIINDPFLLAVFTMSITFGFIVGLTTANFGALVRYAIPAKLFLVMVLVLLYSVLKTKNAIQN